MVTDETEELWKDLDNKYDSFSVTAKKYFWVAIGINFILLAGSGIAWYYDQILIAIVLFILGMPFTEEWYKMGKKLIKMSREK